MSAGNKEEVCFSRSENDTTAPLLTDTERVTSTRLLQWNENGKNSDRDKEDDNDNDDHCQRHENDDVNNRATKAMTDDKENNIDRDNSIVNDNNEDKKIFFFVLSQAWDKEKILSPRSESNLRPSDFALRCFTTEPQSGERGLLQSSYDTRPKYC